ncbi:MAG: hypothetical protein QOH00_321 [Gaiellales bacterium]|nr:hypothetical protein [Gaiellales bacterium]
MRKSSPTFTVESFEFVDAAPGLALLRISGTWDAGFEPVDVELVAMAGGERESLPALPAPPGSDGMWRAAFSASPEMLDDPHTAFDLELPDGTYFTLPRPVEHGAAPVAAEDAAELPEPEARKPRFFSRRRATEPRAQPGPEPDPRLAQLDPLAVEREARHTAERLASEQRARAERAEALLSDELRDTVGKTEKLIERIDGYERLRDELDATRSELDAANAHLDTLHDAHSLELRAARSQRDQAEERRVGTEEKLAETLAAVEALRAQLEERQGLIERARAEAVEAGAELADVHAAVAHLRDAISARAREVATSQRRFERTPEALNRSRDELARDAERIAALERQAEALRDAIHSQLPYSLHASPLQEALPLTDAND